MRPASLLPFALGAGLAAVALVAKGGTEPASATWAAMGATLVGGALVVAALLLAPTPRRRWGVVTLALLGALAGWTAASISWAVNPGEGWLEANRVVSYVAAFAGAMAVARLAPERGRTILVAVMVACLTVSVIALLDKALPAATNSTAELARLREPLGYWNALGLLAAFAVPPCLWLGARREGSPIVRALAYPLVGLALVTAVFSYSRGALLALVIGLAFWFAFVPLRLRGLTVLGVGLIGTVALSAWTFAQPALAQDRQPLVERVAAGQWLALLLVVMLAVLFAAGVAVERLGPRISMPARVRRGVSLGLVCAVALLPVAGIGALALSERGLTGSVSAAWNSIFGTGAGQLSYTADRLTTTNTKRGDYWREARQIWERNKLEGAGAGGYATARLLYRRDTVDVRHAHGYVAQTAADLGLVGLLLSLAIALTFAGAAARSVRRRVAGAEVESASASLDPRRWPGAVIARVRGLAPGLIAARARGAYQHAGEPVENPGPVETARYELLTLVTVVIIFALHSAIDWTWAFPGTALVALVCAGYVAGHGPPGQEAAARSAPVLIRIAAAAIAALITLVALWAIWQPQRSFSAIESSSELMTAKRPADAMLLAQRAVKRNPVSAEPLFQLADVQAQTNRKLLGRGTLQRAVRMQPRNPDTWRELASYQLTVMGSAPEAYKALRAALALDPRSPLLRAEFKRVFDQLPRRGPGGKPAGGRRAGGGGKPTPGGADPATAARCRDLEQKLREKPDHPKAAKRREKLAECRAELRGAG